MHLNPDRLVISSGKIMEQTSMAELAGHWDKLLYKSDGTPVREVLLRHRDGLRSLYKRIEENIADWNLAPADGLLYEMEDIFDKIESELD